MSYPYGFGARAIWERKKKAELEADPVKAAKIAKWRATFPKEAAESDLIEMAREEEWIASHPLEVEKQDAEELRRIQDDLKWRRENPEQAKLRDLMEKLWRDNPAEAARLEKEKHDRERIAEWERKNPDKVAKRKEEQAAREALIAESEAKEIRKAYRKFLKSAVRSPPEEPPATLFPSLKWTKGQDKPRCSHCGEKCHKSEWLDFCDRECLISFAESGGFSSK